ncbi:MAG: Do family serine endopeptidase [Alphaproteobacteria bacterium]|nr:Do family serine endopeptidase [Alphaproteobacteria bacterium]
MTFFKWFFILIFSSLVMVSCKEAPEVKEEVQKQVPLQRQEIMMSYAPVVKQVAPAVVNIFAYHHVKVDLPNSPFLQDPFFKELFDQLHKGAREQSSLGSGVIVSKEGLVLTNYHVIENADVIRVVLYDKREYVAKLVGTDKRTDLALLQIEGGDNFPALKVAPQDDLEVGDVVLAIGNPFGVGQSVTNGIVSALARSQEGISDYRSFIQTDAAINPGNSGGALVTTDGRLVGINTAIYSKSGGSIGIGFAIPTSLALPVIESAKNGGRIMRPWIGLDVESVTAEVAHALGLPRPYGVLVRGIYPGSPADAAGVKVGDFIAALNNREIEDDASLDYQVAISPVGQKAEITLIRKGEEKKLPVLLTEPMDAKDPSSFTIKGPNPLHGVSVRTLSPALALEMGLSPMKRGVVITDMIQNAPAVQLGLQPGDILESINKKAIKTKEDAVSLLQQDSHAWIMVIRRGQKTLTLQVMS